MRNHTRARQALTIISTLTALVTGTYIAFGDGFTWDARHHHRQPHHPRGTPRP